MKINRNLKWNFEWFSPISYQVLNIDNGFEGFIDPNIYCEKVLSLIAKAIERKEDSPKSWNNPGAIKGLNGQFLKFASYQKGCDYLLNYLERAVTGKHPAYPKGISVHDFFKIYAPSSDNNNPLKYAEDVVQWVGLISIHDKIEDWLLTEFEWARKHRNAEALIFPMNRTGDNSLKDKQIAQFNYISYLFKKLWSLIYKDK